MRQVSRSGWRNINVSKANRKPTSLLSIRFSLVHHGFLCPFCNLQLRDCACHSHAFEITTTGKQITKFATCKSRFVSPSLVHSSSVSVPVHLTSPSIYITRGGGADVAYVIPRSSSTLARARACLKGGFPCSAEHQKRMEWTEMNWHAGGSQRIWHSCLPCVVLLHIYSLRTRNTLPFRVFFLLSFFLVARTVKLAYVRSILKSHNATTPFINRARMSLSIMNLMALPSPISHINIPQTGSECHTGGEEHDKVLGSVGTPAPPLAIRRQARGLTRQVGRLTSFPTPWEN